MTLKIYRILYIVLLSLSLLGIITSLAYTLYLATQGVGLESDNILFFLCFLVLTFINGFQIYAIIHSFKNGSVFFKNVILNDSEKLNKVSLSIANTFGLLAISFAIYCTLLLSGLEIPLNGFPIALNILIICFMILILINVIFFDLYTLIYKEDK